MPTKTHMGTTHGPMPATRADYEAAVLAGATHFTRVQFLGARQYETYEHATESEAVEAARSDPRPRPWMIYAVDALGRSAHLRNVEGGR